MTIVPDFVRCLIYIVICMACFTAIAFGTLLLDSDRPSFWFFAIPFTAMWLIFVPAGAVIMRLMLQLTIDDEKLVQGSGPLRVEIPFDEISSVRHIVLGFTVSRGLWARDILIPTLFLKRSDYCALRKHLRNVLPQNNALQVLADPRMPPPTAEPPL